MASEPSQVVAGVYPNPRPAATQPYSLYGASLDYDEGLSQRRIVRKGDVEHGLMAGGRHAPQTLHRPTRQAKGRLSGGKIDDFHIPPEDAMAEARAKGLRAGLLGGEPSGIGRRPRGAPVAPGAFALGENAMGEAIPETFDGTLDATDVAEIRPDAENHGRSLLEAISLSFPAKRGVGDNTIVS
jgi:hypothetical protein